MSHLIMKNILIISGHTDLNDSVANKTILSMLEAKLPESRVVRLDALYTHKPIDVAAEQANLLWADVIVLQFPVFWFSMPSLLHRWMEEVFLHGFSHGSTGDKLRGKTLVLSYTTGAPADCMNWDDFFEFLRGACHFTGMNYGGSVHTGSVSYNMRQDSGMMETITQSAQQHAERLVAHLNAL